MNDRVRIERKNGIATVTLNRGDKHNSMDIPMLDAVRGAARDLKKDSSVRVVILRGDGPSFCSGIDVKNVLGNPKMAALAFAALVSPVRNRFQDWSMAWREVPAPVIACIHGNCFGAGIQLALGADIRIATPDAKLSVMEAKWGIIPDMGGAALLRELIPIDMAKELAMTARILSGADAKGLGLVTHLAADPLAHAMTLAAELMERSPDAVAAAKFLMQEARDDSESGALASERRWQRRLMGTANQRIAARRNIEKADVPYRPRKVKS